MNFNISVINVEKATATSKAGKPYQLVEISYKNLTSGKVEGNKVNQYSDLYSTAAGMQAGEQYTITKEKVGEFWNWTKIVQAAPGTQLEAPSTKSPGGPAASTPVRSTYETPEERAKKQVYIVKQSSISAAIATLSVGAKAVKPDDVITLAQQYTDFVFGTSKEKVDLFNTPNDDLDDVPM